MRSSRTVGGLEILLAAGFVAWVVADWDGRQARVYGPWAVLAVLCLSEAGRRLLVGQKRLALGYLGGAAAWTAVFLLRAFVN